MTSKQHFESEIKETHHVAVGRRIGRPLSDRRKALIAEGLPKYTLNLDKPIDAQFDCAAANKPLVLEVGFGGGEHLAACASRAQHKNFIGCEYYLNGVASLLDQISVQNIENIRIYSGHAQEVLAVLAEGSLERCTVLFPDPWPKARHAKRRFLQTATLERLAQLLCTGCELRLASDHPIMVAWIEELLSTRRDFRHLQGASREAIGLDHNAWPETRYERKALNSGLSPTYFRSIKL